MRIVEERDSTAANRKFAARDEGGNPLSFQDDGVFFLVPNITQDDLIKLRAGGKLNPKEVELTITYFDAAKQKFDKVFLTVAAKDYEGSGIFFGDRPLENPGYSELKLSGAVGTTGQPDVVDVYKVEQRLKYLGYPAFNNPTTSSFFTPANSNPRHQQEFEVDGTFANKEKSALRAFYAATHLANRDFNWGIEDVPGTANTVSSGSDNFAWLNAYNAPHWMDIYDSLSVLFGGQSADFKDNQGTKEIYGTSWMRDLLKAWQTQKVQLSSAGLGTGVLWLNGFTDPGYRATDSQGNTIHHRGNHSIGMGVDLGVSGSISPGNQNAQSPAGTGNNPNINVATVPGSGWSMDRARDLSALLPAAMTASNGPLNNQRQALRNFLALYAITREDDIAGNGTWDDLVSRIVNGRTPDEISAIHRALFGNARCKTGTDHVFLLRQAQSEGQQ